MQRQLLRSRGFTIVELLIVIVVIAILAAISIVAYNGIQNRARASEVSSALSQAVKKIQVWQVDNGTGAPSDLATAGVSSSGNVTYQYTPGSNGAYCITATSGSTSYRVTNSSAPTQGGCAGHGQGGVAAVTNHITNTSVETNTNQLANIGNASGRTIQREQVSDAYSGNHVLRVTANSSGQLAGYGSTTLDTLPNGTYVGSLWVRSNAAIVISPYFEGSATRTNNNDTGGGTLTPNTWTRLSRTFTITSPGTVKVGYLVGNNPGNASSTYVDMDGIMLTSGSTLYGFADGGSSDWIWNGTANSSTSTGPAL